MNVFLDTNVVIDFMGDVKVSLKMLPRFLP